MVHVIDTVGVTKWPFGGMAEKDCVKISFP